MPRPHASPQVAALFAVVSSALENKWPGAAASGHRCSLSIGHDFQVRGRLGGFLLVVVDLGELRVDNIVLLARLAARRCASPLSASSWPAVTRLAFLLRLVH